MKPQTLTLSFLACFIFVVFTSPAQAAKIGYNFAKSTPVGSWQIREQTTTNHKGKKTVATIKNSLVGKEKRGDEMHYWVEMEMQAYKIKKKGKRKKDGERTIVKVLIPQSSLNRDFSNTVNNLRSYGKEIIIQHGNDDPLLITGGGMLAEKMMQATGTEIKHNFKVIGTEKVTVPAGSYKAKKIAGSGSTETKGMFKTIKVESKSTMWIANGVPFGIVKIESNDTVNGKPQTGLVQLIKHGKSGATTQITKTPQALPNIPNMFGGQE